MVGNLESHTAWAMRFTFCVTPALNWWDQRAGFVRKAWPGAASSRPAEVRIQHRSLPICHPIFPTASPLPTSVFPLLHLDHHSSCSLSHWSILQPCHHPLCNLPFYCSLLPFIFFVSCMSQHFLRWDTFHKWPMIIFPLYLLWYLSREVTKCCDMRYSNYTVLWQGFFSTLAAPDLMWTASRCHYSLSNT